MILAKVDLGDGTFKYLEYKNGYIRTGISPQSNFNNHYTMSNLLEIYENINNHEFQSKYKSDLIVKPTHIFENYIINISDNDIFYDVIEKYIKTFIHKNLKILDDL